MYKFYIIYFIYLLILLVEEEKAKIINKVQIHDISRNILIKCNYINKKSNFNNKTTKAGDGKLMITSGLTVNDFTNKYNLPL